MSPTLAPTAAAPALVQNDLLESGFDGVGSLPSPAAPVPAAVAAAAAAAPILPAVSDPVPAAQAPPGGFNASSKAILLFRLRRRVRYSWGNVSFTFAQVSCLMHSGLLRVLTIDF